MIYLRQIALGRLISSSKSPLIIGHRGAAALAPENTLAAFALALREGADGVEFDVRLSADGVPVVIHDATLRRTANRRERVSSMAMAELENVDVGSWFNRRFRAHARDEYSSERLPSLQQLFAALSGNSAWLYLELKSDGEANPKLVTRVAELINCYGFHKRVIIESFTLENLRFVKRIDHRIKTAALFAPPREPMSVLRGSSLIKRALAVGADEIAFHYSAASQRNVSAACEAGLEVVVWTVDTPSWMRRARRLGIKGLITNRPAEMLRARYASD